MARKTYIDNNDFSSSLLNYLSLFTHLDEETIPSIDSVGRVTAAAIFALQCDPVYNAAAMDGIATSAALTATADCTSPCTLTEGEDFVYVNTGNPVPARFDCVVMIEDVIDVGAGRIQLLSAAHPYQHVRVIGESFVSYEMVLPSNRRIRPIDLGAILASGNDTVRVIRAPRVGIIPTGEEMVESAAEVRVGKLRESNTRVFCAMTAEAGGIPTRYPIIADRREDLERAIVTALAENDLVVVNAGSSAGTKDFTVEVLAKLGRVVTHGLAIKPGKPTILAVVEGKPVIGVPGYPVSAYLVYEKVVLETLARLGGVGTLPRQTVQAVVTKRLTSTLKNEEFIRVSMGEVDGRLVASPLERGAAAIASMVKADGLLRIPVQSEGIEAGETVTVELLRSQADIKKSLVVVGSHDMIVDVLGDTVPLTSSHVGSMSGLFALQSGGANIAPIHLLDGDTGEYNVSFVRKYFAGQDMVLVKGVGRVQGFILPRGNPLGISSIRDVAERGLSFANRQGGAGTRLLLDYMLSTQGISPTDIVGYTKEFTTHLAVATAVKNGVFDTGLGVLSAAKCMDMDFLPVAEEEYDFLVRAELLEDERMLAFLDALRSDAFKKRLDELGGYTYTRIGEIVRLSC